jgi:MFS family permease
MNPLQSGLLTCASAVGAMFMKTLTTVILRRFGFRKVLTVNAVVASAAIGVFGLFTAATPHIVIFLVLLASGCLRSLQFTALQAVSFAEVTRETMSQASSIASMAQRLAQSLGVALGAYALQISSLAQGHTDVVSADFAPAFVAVALLSAMSLFFHAALPADAGAKVSGHGRAK